MEKRLSTASIVVMLLTLTLQEAIVISQETCNFVKWMMCEKGMSQAGKFSLPKYVRVENFLCDTQTDGGGWIVFQRRFKRDIEFNKSWKEYKQGFGSKCNDYWLGNDYLHIATKWGTYELRIDMVYYGKHYFAQYSNFKVDSEKNKYRLSASGFHGNVTEDDFLYHSGHPFSTLDVDNTVDRRNCSQYGGGGWWFLACHTGNLNGQFDNEEFSRGVNWLSLTTYFYSLSTVEMKLRLRK